MTNRSEQERIDKALSGFREIAQVKLEQLCADERMVSHVRARIEQSPQRVRPASWAFGLAAACLVVMLVSGALLLPNLMGRTATRQMQDFSVDVSPAALTAPKPLALATEQLSYSQDGTPLPYTIVEAQPYVENYAVALASNGLYGYLDEDGRWAVAAIYDKAEAVCDGCANVTLNGREMTIVLP